MVNAGKLEIVLVTQAPELRRGVLEHLSAPSPTVDRVCDAIEMRAEQSPSITEALRITLLHVAWVRQVDRMQTDPDYRPKRVISPMRRPGWVGCRNRTLRVTPAGMPSQRNHGKAYIDRSCLGDEDPEHHTPAALMTTTPATQSEPLDQ